MRVLVVNAGSSSLKLRLLDGRDEVTAAADLAAPRGAAGQADLERALAGLGPGSPLDIADPREAAGHLAALTFGQINNRTLFGLLQLTDDELDAIVDGGVGVFVRAYRRA